MVYDKCMFNHELLVSYSTGNSDPEVRTTVERHLAKCHHCREEVVELEKAWWALNTWDDELQPAQPRLNDLRARLTAIEPEEQSFASGIAVQARYLWNRYAYSQTVRMAFAASIGVLVMIPWMQVQSPVPVTGAVSTVQQETDARSPNLELEFQQALEAGQSERTVHRVAITMDETKPVQTGIRPSSDVSPSLIFNQTPQPIAASYYASPE